jgi:serine/threonine-protein kinase
VSADPRLPELFEHARELVDESRAAWLADLRRSEPALAREIEELLAAAPAGELLLGSPAWRLLDLDSSELAVSTAPPERVGPYRILREIGRGGMGRVFLAEQEGEEFRRRVALKVLDRPMAARDDVRRFRDEVRILATLEHPGIARFLDGGRSQDGIWFLALEYVEGVDLLSHVRVNEPTLVERLRIFLEVLEAVAYAHARSVVHRDLKPGNIIVGGDGRPRLLDFGISKLVDRGEGEAIATTRTELRAFTPAYASPEQFRGERATTASDVYSLGVILYELLTGVSPYPGENGSRKTVETAVLTADPEPPSKAARHRSRLAYTSQREASSRAQSLSSFGRIDADLDAICLKALRKEPSGRYLDAAALAADVRRYLGGLPVEARRGGRRYRLGRLVRRNRVLLLSSALAAVAIAAVVLAAVISIRSSRVPTTVDASPARAPAPTPPPGASIEELEKLFAASPESVETGAALATALDSKGRSKEGLGVVGRMRQIPGAAEDPLTDLTEAWIATTIDEPQRALALTTRALSHPRTAMDLSLSMRIRAVRGRALSMLGRRDEARAELEQTVRDAESLGDHAALSRNLNDLAIEEAQRGDLARGEELFEQSLAAVRSIGQRGGTMLKNLSSIAIFRGRPDVAVERSREAAAIYRELGNPRRLGMALIDLSTALRELGRVEEVEGPLEEATALLRQASHDSGLGLVLFERGDLEINRGQLDSIAGLADEMENTSQTSGDQTNLARAEYLRGLLAAARGDTETARRQFAEAGRLLQQLGHADVASFVELSAAILERDDGNPVEASRLAGEVAATFPGTPGDIFEFRGESLLARLAVDGGRLDEAGRRLAALGSGAEHRPGVVDRISFLAARASLSRAQRRFDAARRDLETAIAAARDSWLKLDELDLRLDLAETELDAGNREAAAGSARAVAEEAASVGLGSLEARARRLGLS